MHRLIAIGSLLALAAAAIASCALPAYELSPETLGTTTGMGGTTATTSSGGAGGQGGCQSKSFPPPSENATSSPDDAEDFVMAIETVRFGENDVNSGVMGSPYGFDLDSECTCHPDKSATTCLRPEGATICDGPDGEDNATAEVFRQFVELGGVGVSANFESKNISEKIKNEGDWSLLIRVRGYNGQSEDKQVTVSVHPSPGFEAKFDPCLDGKLPNWDGEDRWPVDAKSLQEPVSPAGAGGSGGGGGGGMPDCSVINTKGYDLDKPAYEDTNAYVTNSIVVANLSDTPIVVAGADSYTQLKLKAGFLTGPLEKVGDRWQITGGTLAARWPLKEVFRTLATVELGGSQLCTDNLFFEPVQDAICRRADITVDITGPTTPCDALSFGMGFDAKPARFGNVFVTEGDQSVCPPKTDPANVVCDEL